MNTRQLCEELVRGSFASASSRTPTYCYAGTPSHFWDDDTHKKCALTGAAYRYWWGLAKVLTKTIRALPKIRHQIFSSSVTASVGTVKIGSALATSAKAKAMRSLPLGIAIITPAM
jgi:hypothetical protein